MATRPDNTTEEPTNCDCSECGSQYGVERRETNAGRTEILRWCQDCGEETN